MRLRPSEYRRPEGANLDQSGAMANASIGAPGVAVPRTDGFARWRGRTGSALVAYVAVAAVAIPLVVLEDPLLAWLGFLAASALPLVGLPIGDVLLLGAVTYLALAGRTTGAASRLLAGALVALLLADVSSATYLSGPAGERWADVLWALSYVLIGAAALVPSMRELTEPAPATARLASRRRILRLLAALLVLPVAAIAQLLLVGHLDAEVILVAAVVLGAMLLVSTMDAAREAARRERRWATMLSKASDSLAITAADGTLTYVSPASEHIMKAPVEHKIGTSVMRFERMIHPADQAGPGARLAEAVRTPGAVVKERLRVPLPDGSLRWLEILARNLVDDPDVKGVVFNYRDITGEVEANQELKDRDRLLAAAEALAQVGSVEWHIDSDTHVWSPGMWALLGVEPGSLTMDEVTFLARVHPDDVVRLGLAYARLLEDRRTTSLDFRIVRPDGSHVQVHGIGKVESADDGRSERVITTFRDVTAEREAKRQLQSQADILANVRESIVVTDLDGRVTYWGNGAATLFGYQAREMLGQPLESIYPDAAVQILEDLARTDAGSVNSGEVTGRGRDGLEVTLDVRSTVLWSAEGEPIGYISLAIDATERRAAHASLDRLWVAIEQSSESVLITDAEARIEYVNPAFERITGYSRAEVVGQNPRILKSGAQTDAVYQSMWSTLLAGRPWRADLVNRRKDGSRFEEQAAISPIHDRAGTLSGFVAVKRDVTEERRLEAEALRSARERSLIAQTMRGIASDASPEAVAEIVGRQLSRLNDVSTAGLFIFGPDQCAVPYGFTVGGEPITAFGPVPRRRSGYLLDHARRGPWIAAWHDRPWHPYNKVFMDAGVAAIAYAPVHHGGDVIGFLHLSCTGEGASGTLATHLPALVQFADVAGALLGARLTELNASEATRQGISRVIDGSAFIPVFQPIVDIKRGEVVGYEGLTRFRDQVRPDLKFAEAERAGMGRQLELATLQAAVAASRDLPETAWLDLNVSPRLIMEGTELVQALSATERQIVLEVTEHEEIDDYECFRSAADRLGRDVRIAVDDAGSGYASLRHILELRPALVKLDRALIMGIESDQARRALVAGMRQFAGDVDIQLIAEGIETQGELEALRDLDIELGQGYLLGRPRPAKQISSARHAANHRVAGAN